MGRGRSRPRKQGAVGGHGGQESALTGDATRTGPVYTRTPDRALSDAILDSEPPAIESTYRDMGRQSEPTLAGAAAAART